MTSNSLTENEVHGSPSQILKTIFGLNASVIFLDPNMCGFQYIFRVLWPLSDAELLWSIRRTICLYCSTRVDLCCHQILLIWIFVIDTKHFVIDRNSVVIRNNIGLTICAPKITLILIYSNTFKHALFLHVSNMFLLVDSYEVFTRLLQGIFTSWWIYLKRNRLSGSNHFKTP